MKDELRYKIIEVKIINLKLPFNHQSIIFDIV